MAKLIYTTITSLDGYVADREGRFDWAAPDPDVHAFVNQLERGIGTYLYGRRLYEVMMAWADPEAFADEVAMMREYGEIWRAADKIVYSTTMQGVTTARTRLERRFEPDVVRQMKERASRDLSVGGPSLAAHAIREGLVDEYQRFVTPVLVGGGTRWLPDEIRVDLELLDESRFDNGVVFLRYGIR